MNNLSNFLDTPLGVIIIIVLLVLTAIAAWGAYAGGPATKTEALTPPLQETKPETADTLAETPKKDLPPAYEGPCATERAEIDRLKEEVRELKEAKQRPKEPQRVTSENVAGLVNNLGEVNRKTADDLRVEAKKNEPNFSQIRGQLERFATYLEQRGFQRPDLGQLLEMLQTAFKQ